MAASRPKNTPASMSSNGSQPRYGARPGSSLGGHTKFSGPTPVPPIALRSAIQGGGVEMHRVPGRDVDLGLGALGEQVAALPLLADVAGVGVLQTRDQDLLAQSLGGAVLEFGTPARPPTSSRANR